MIGAFEFDLRMPKSLNFIHRPLTFVAEVYWCWSPFATPPKFKVEFWLQNRNIKAEILLGNYQLFASESA